MTFNKTSYFQILSVKLMSYGPLNRATHIFTRLECLITISDRRWIAGVCMMSKLNKKREVNKNNLLGGILNIVT